MIESILVLFWVLGAFFFSEVNIPLFQFLNHIKLPDFYRTTVAISSPNMDSYGKSGVPSPLEEDSVGDSTGLEEIWSYGLANVLILSGAIPSITIAGLRPPKSDDEVFVIGFENVSVTSNQDNWFIAEELPVGLKMMRIRDHIENIATFGDLLGLNEEDFASQVTKNLFSTLELMERMEGYILETWISPKPALVDDIISTLEGLLMAFQYEEDDLRGWHLNVFHQVDGPNFIRNLLSRYQLLKQARDVTKKITGCLKSEETSEFDKIKIRRFIKAKTERVQGGDWFEEAVNLLRSLNVTIMDGEIIGLNGIDLEVAVGSEPDCETLREDLNQLDIDSDSEVSQVDEDQLEIPYLAPATTSDSESDISLIGDSFEFAACTLEMQTGVAHVPCSEVSPKIFFV